MAQAIRRKNIAAVQQRRKDMKVRRYIRGAFNAAICILGLASFFIIPMVLEAYAPSTQPVHAASQSK